MGTVARTNLNPFTPDTLVKLATPDRLGALAHSVAWDLPQLIAVIHDADPDRLLLSRMLVSINTVFMIIRCQAVELDPFAIPSLPTGSDECPEPLGGQAITLVDLLEEFSFELSMGRAESKHFHAVLAAWDRFAASLKRYAVTREAERAHRAANA